MGDQIMTRAEFAGITATLTTTSKLYQIRWRRGQLRLTTTTPTTETIRTEDGNQFQLLGFVKTSLLTYRKSKYSNESDLEYYERRYYTKLKDDYYKFEISDSIYRCPFCYNKDYSLSDLLRHASRIAGNSCSRKMLNQKMEMEFKKWVVAHLAQSLMSEHHMEVAAEAMDENTESASSSSQLQGDVENKVLGDSSLSTEKHSIYVHSVTEPIVSIVREYSFTEPIVSIEETDGKSTHFASLLGLRVPTSDEVGSVKQIEEDRKGVQP
ncbi:XS zinc finger protein [Medicago truncatula]|uniref:XS zinc finger protein n=1 Tax=Medicago truncatula TaxID=3880 RepID=G7IR25_MEDTR|nr:XS zinc finger protein [Medicago truncatula]